MNFILLREKKGSNKSLMSDASGSSEKAKAAF